MWPFFLFIDEGKFACVSPTSLHKWNNDLWIPHEKYPFNYLVATTPKHTNAILVINSWEYVCCYVCTVYLLLSQAANVCNYNPRFVQINLEAHANCSLAFQLPVTPWIITMDKVIDKLTKRLAAIYAITNAVSRTTKIPFFLHYSRFKNALVTEEFQGEYKHWKEFDDGCNNVLLIQM